MDPLIEMADTLEPLVAPALARTYTDPFEEDEVKKAAATVTRACRIARDETSPERQWLTPEPLTRWAFAVLSPPTGSRPKR